LRELEEREVMKRLTRVFALVAGFTVLACRAPRTPAAEPPAPPQQPAPELSIPPVPTQAGPSSLFVKAGQLLDPESGKAEPGQSLVIRDGKIAAIGPDLAMPDGALVLDHSQSFVLPGLFDAHTHLCSTMSARWHVEEFLVYSLAEPAPFRAIRGVVNAREMLEAGFTTVRDLGNAGDYADLALVRAIESGLVPGPTVVAAGRIIAPFGGQFRWRTRKDVLADPEYYFADSRDELRRAIRENIYYGARVIKVVVDGQAYAYSEDDLRFIVEEARNAGRRVAAHCQTQEGARRAARAGVASIEHGWTLDDADLALLKKYDVTLVSTDFTVAVLEANAMETKAAQAFHAKLVDRLRRAHAAGVRIAFGTDIMLELPGQTRGSLALSYLGSFVEAGIPAADILRSLTTIPARLLGVEKERGRLAVGMAGDLIAVPADPRTDLGALYRTELVVKSGRVVRQGMPRP
jgi:imidazolonepropionase-like amidohydrolase